jgi:hypothetical protein
MKVKYLVPILIFIFSIVGGFAYSAFHYHGKSVEASKDLAKAVAERDSAEKITSSAINLVNLFNEIARANEDAKQKNSNDSEPVRVVYKTILAKTACSRDAIDGNVADGLYNRANKIRSGPSSADPVQSDGSLHPAPP